MKIHKFISVNAVLALMCLLPACVTTTTGGFNVAASDEQALQDYIQLATAYYDANDMTGARRHVSSAMAIDDSNSDIYTILALILQREGDLELAEDNFQRAISLNRDNSRARNNYGVYLFGQDRFSEAYDQLERVANDTNYVGRAFAFENLGRSALRLDRMDDAESAFMRALQLDANLYVSALELSQIRFDRQNWNSARQSYQQFLTILDFYNIAHTPRSLWIGIQIERIFQNSQLVNDFSLLLSTLYQDSPEYQLYRRSSNGNR
ncbi:MAG: type IV pilus biogenesis/stability protein PilW [Gammaproteobacteria bacterium]|nr:type IV pilus biogenesis/stability protein PilW [Gammaproteobacteria bacterium]MDP6094817.1 type IV pilus biogenesis/stability protein PilW [Gammaproteobacteria bacterium]MDP7455435.1 type IV pilus biogenesis/stability protein PilW [Gammaproteobacteria bacterium]